MIKQYDEVIKVSTGPGDDYKAGCLLDYTYFKDNNKLKSVELNKKKALDADPRAIQQIVFQGVVLVYRIDLYFHKHKLAIEVDELGHAEGNLSNETGRQKALEK